MFDQMQHSEQPSLASVATPAFFPSIIAFLRSTSPTIPLPLDPVILQSILLCVIAGDKHLILQTPQEDVGLVVKLSLWILSVVFDFKTHKLKIRPRVGSPSLSTDPAPHLPFLRSLFVPRSSSQHFYQDSQDETESVAQPRLKHPKPRHHKAKFKAQLAPVDSPYISPPRLRSPSPSPPTPLNDPLRGRSYSATRKPMSDNEVASQTRPTTHSLHKHSSSVSGMSHELPRALVISGLHYASTLSQRSLVTVLTGKRVVLDNPQSNTILPSHTELEDGTWNLPDGFLIIYVCPFNGRERPAIHKSLLDKFAMSANVNLDQSARQAIMTISPSPNHPLSPNQSLPSSPLSTHPLHSPPSKHGQGLPGTPRSTSSQLLSPLLIRPLLHPSFIKSLRNYWKHTYFSSQLSLYLADLMTATRHHPELDGTLLTARSQDDAHDLSRAIRVLGVNPTGMELARYPSTDERDPDLSSLDLQDQDNTVPDGYGQGEHTQESIATSPNTTSLESRPSPKVATSTPPDVVAIKDSLNVTEADVARIVPRVVTHRLRVRDGPEDEIFASAVYGATIPVSGVETGANRSWEKKNVKDILVKILVSV